MRCSLSVMRRSLMDGFQSAPGGEQSGQEIAQREIPRLQSAVNICTRGTSRSCASAGCTRPPPAGPRYCRRDSPGRPGPSFVRQKGLDLSNKSGQGLSFARPPDRGCRPGSRLYAGVSIAYLGGEGSADGRAGAGRAHSSAGQSSGLIIRRSQVRVLLGPSPVRLPRSNAAPPALDWRGRPCCSRHGSDIPVPRPAAEARRRSGTPSSGCAGSPGRPPQSPRRGSRHRRGSRSIVRHP